MPEQTTSKELNSIGNGVVGNAEAIVKNCVVLFGMCILLRFEAVMIEPLKLMTIPEPSPLVKHVVPPLAKFPSSSTKRYRSEDVTLPGIAHPFNLKSKFTLEPNWVLVIFHSRSNLEDSGQLGGNSRDDDRVAHIEP